MLKRLLAVALILAVIPFIVACKHQNTPDTNKDNNEKNQTETSQTDNKKPSDSSEKEDAGKTPDKNDKENESEATVKNPFVNDKNDKDTPVSNQKPQGETSAQENGNSDKNDAQKPQVEKEEMEPITEVPDDFKKCTYEEYQAMTAETQKTFFEKFENVEAFFDWYNDAKAKYEKENAAIEIGNGEINLGDVLNGKK